MRDKLNSEKELPIKIRPRSKLSSALTGLQLVSTEKRSIRLLTSYSLINQCIIL